MSENSKPAKLANLEIVLQSSGSEVFDNPTVQDFINERLDTVDFGGFNGGLLVYVFGELNDPDHIAKFNALLADLRLLKAKIISNNS